jgi:hypothetical protein
MRIRGWWFHASTFRQAYLKENQLGVESVKILVVVAWYTHFVQANASPHIGNRDKRHDDERAHHITLSPCLDNERIL